MINETGLEYPPGGDLTLRRALKTEQPFPGQRDTSNMKNDKAKAWCSLCLMCSLYSHLCPQKSYSICQDISGERE